MDLDNSRKIDIENRGKYLLVFDYDKSKKYLINCSIWSDDNGNYIKPMEVNNNLRYHSFCNIS